MYFFRNLPIFLAIFVGLISCERDESLNFLTAASTVDAVKEVVAASGMEVRVVSAGSNQLASQILAGAPADVFLSADVRWAEALGDIKKASTPLLSNRLCIVTKESDLIHSMSDLESIQTLALADEEVPAGRYAKEALAKADVQPKRSVHGRNVRNALAWVIRGEAEAGIVYTTDAAAVQSVVVALEVPENLHSEITYPLLRLSDREEAKRFYDFVCGPEASAIFEKHGFRSMVVE